MIGGIILTEWFLPFILVFVICFAILEKSKILGNGVSRIDALVSLAVGFLAVSLPYSRDVIVDLMPWLGVGLASLFVFFVLYAFIAGDKMMEEPWIKYVLLGLVSVFSIGVIFYVTGFWELISSKGFSFGGESLSNLVFIIIVGILVFWVMRSTSGSSSGS
jgi:hypothetical protein